MTAIGGFIAPEAAADDIGVHSLDHFVLAVPDLKVAEHFYGNFGLDIGRDGNALSMKTFGHDHRWGSVVEGERKQLGHLSFGCYADDLARLKARIEGQGIALIDPPKGFESNGFWFRDPDGVMIEVKVAAKVSPDSKTPDVWHAGPTFSANAPPRSKAPIVSPRRLSHCLIFVSDISQSIEFYSRTVGMRLSDRSRDIVAFMHGIHGSDHHLVAFVKSDAPGFHHCSWDVSSINDIGLGASNMADKGYIRGWGLGRHVLGSNFFHYIQDPWGSFCEYSCDIDYIPGDQRWPSGDHPPEDSFYLWGPVVPADFAHNYESAASAAYAAK